MLMLTLTRAQAVLFERLGLDDELGVNPFMPMVLMRADVEKIMQKVAPLSAYRSAVAIRIKVAALLTPEVP